MPLCSLADGAFDPNPAMMCFDNLPARGETKASPAFAGFVGPRLGGKERFEDAG